MSLTDLNSSDFDSNDFLSSRRDKSHCYSESRLPEIASLTSLDKVNLKKFPIAPAPFDNKHVPDFLNVPGPVALTKAKSNNNAVPKVSKRLPAAFATFTKSSSNSENKKAFGHNIFMQPSHEPVDVLEHMVNAQEYKYTKGLLSPLQHQITPRKMEAQMSAFNFKEDKHRTGDPLGPLKDYMLLSKPDDANVYFDLALDKPRKLYRLHKEVKISRKDVVAPKQLSLSEMITLQIIKSSHETGVVKKMIHGPTLKLYAVKEVPLATRENRNSIKQWLDQWQAEFKNSKRHLQVHTTYFNVPEGCLSIVMEISNAGSLQNLLDSVNTIPETALKTVAAQTLLALNDVHTKLNMPHGVVCPSQVLLDKSGNVKLSLGLAHKLQSGNSGPTQNQKKFTFEKANFLDKPNSTQPSFSPRTFLSPRDPKKNDETQQLEISQDIFDFGWLMLKCAIGDLDLFGTDFTNKVKAFLEEYNKRPEEKQKFCCVIHDEDLISCIDLSNGSLEKAKNKLKKSEGKKNAIHISLKDLLTAGNFSKHFTDFLCYCLRFDSKQRYNASSLLNSAFIKEKKVSGPLTTLSEVLETSVQLTKNFVLPAKYQAASEKQLDKLCSALSILLALPPSSSGRQGGEEKTIKELEDLSIDSPVIQDLAGDLGLPPMKVWTELKSLVKDF